jgi:hypothetical protein
MRGVAGGNAWRAATLGKGNLEEITTMRITALLAAVGLMVALAGQSHADEIDWAKVDAALGKTASVQDNVHRYGIPRSDPSMAWPSSLRSRSEAGLVSSR